MKRLSIFLALTTVILLAAALASAQTNKFTEWVQCSPLTGGMTL
jgi:hypothetical protein